MTEVTRVGGDQGAEMVARQIERAGSGLGYGLWAGFLGAMALAIVYLGAAAVVLVIVGVGIMVLPSLFSWMDRLGVIFAEKASHAVGHRLIPAEPLARVSGSAWDRFRGTMSSRRTYRIAAWAAVMGVTGILTGTLVLVVVVAFARELTVPLWWWSLPQGAANSALGMPIDSWGQALTTMATAPLYLAVALWVLPVLATGQARLCAAILGCRPVPPSRKPAAVNQCPQDPGRELVVPDGSEPDPRLERLTAREREVLALIAQGLDNAAIAETLVVSQAAVLKHIRSIFVKLDLPPGESGHRRVRAVLMHLAATAHQRPPSIAAGQYGSPSATSGKQ